MTANETALPVVGVFGLGSMGWGMATSLRRAALPVYGFDVAPEREAAFRAEGGLEASDRATAAAALDIAVCVVVNQAQTEDVLFGAQGIAGRLRPGTVFLSCATVAPDFARATAERLAESGVLYLDAPISGGAAKAAEGRLTIMAAGEAAAFERAAPALDAMAETLFRLGEEAGPASAMKIVNQLLAGVHIAAAAEAVTFGLALGIEPRKTYEVITKCAGSSWMFENRVPHILENDYSPRSAVDIFVKDLGIVADTARRMKFSAPMAATALGQFLAASGSGLGGEDDSAVAKVYARNAGLTLPGGG